LWRSPGGLALFLYFAYLGLVTVEKGENVPSVEWLPPSASNVSFYHSYSWTAYEFDIDEQGFLKWAEEWPVAKLTGGRVVTVPRYLRMVLEWPKDPIGPESEAEAEARFQVQGRYQASVKKEIRRGYYYERRDSNGGGVVVGYDLDAGRAYFQSSPR
jgi:hypothetical protein